MRRYVVSEYYVHNVYHRTTASEFIYELNHEINPM